MSNEGTLPAWYICYNYRTNQYDYLHALPKNFADYIPQDEAAQELYKRCLLLGDQPDTAAMKVLKALLDEDE